MFCKASMMIAFFLGTAAVGQADGGKPWFLQDEWLEKNAPYGIDMTPDGQVWITINTSIKGDQYAMLAEDYERRDPKWPQVWIRGYHKANPKVLYRESRSLVHFYCLERSYYSSYEQTYKADRSVHSASGQRSQTLPVIPGSLAEQWMQFACRPK